MTIEKDTCFLQFLHGTPKKDDRLTRAMVSLLFRTKMTRCQPRISIIGNQDLEGQMETMEVQERKAENEAAVVDNAAELNGSYKAPNNAIFSIQRQ